MKFSYDKKGYHTGEVDAYLKKLASDYSRVIDGLRAKVETLSAKLGEREEELAAHKKRAGLIVKSITAAVAKAEEIEQNAKARYDGEIAHLKAFHEKWVAYYNRILSRYPIDEDLAALGEFNREMNQILSGQAEEKFPEDLEENYRSEKARTKTRRIGYITVASDSPVGDEPEDEDYDPVGRIRQFLSSEKGKGEPVGGVPVAPVKNQKQPKVRTETAFAADSREAQDDYSDRSEAGYSFKEALNPKDDLAQIMKDLGLLLEGVNLEDD